MNVVEQQLLSALHETPLETECSVSFRVLEALGFATRLQQEEWLTHHRGPQAGMRWQASDEHWDYCAQRPTIDRETAPPLRMFLPPASPPRSIVVKPLTPLKKLGR